MLTLKVKLVAVLITSANIALFSNLPQIQISVPPSSSPLTLFFSLFNVTSEEACKPDFSLKLDANLTDIPEAFETCTEEISNVRGKTHPDVDKDTGEIIKSYGYPLEIHKVNTQDGYTLTLHRIPRHGKTPVYLQHGLGGCSDNWIFQYRNKSLAFLLAESDMDIWIANSRGTSYSLEHETLQWDNPFDHSYWNFSWHEIAVYDVPAITDYIIEITGKPKIFYVGHSQGTTTYLVALDQVPELNDKLLAGILLAPVGFISRTPSPFRTIAQALGIDPIRKYVEMILKGRVDFRKKYLALDVLHKTFADICTPTAMRCTACDQTIFFFYGLNAPQMNYTNIPNIVAKYPNIFSVKTGVHYAQSVNDCSFRKFDYGPIRNLLVYNSTIPPAYTLKNVKVPTYSFYGEFDNLCRPEDVKRTLDLLPEGTLKANILVNSTYFNHADFLISTEALTLVYENVLSIMEKYREN